MKILWCSVIRKWSYLSSSIRLEGSYHLVDGSFFPRFTFLTRLLHLLSRSYTFFLSLLQITNDVFLTYLQMWLPESDVRRIIRKMLSFHGKTEKNCCLVDTAFSTGCDEKSFVSIFGESAAEPPQPLPAAGARAAAVHRGCFFREEGWLTAPCIAHKNRAPMIHGELIYQKMGP